MKVKYVKRYLSGPMIGLPVEDFYQASGLEDARSFIDATEDLHLQFELSGGTEGWSTDEDGEMFVHFSAVICAEGRA